MAKPKIIPDTTSVRYAGYPTAVVYDKVGKGRKALKQLLWGDWMVVTGKETGGYLPVKSRGCTGFVDAELAMTRRVLEIIFVDIGQGDGCLLVTPDDKHILIDAGAGDNMHRFLRWRYGKFQKEFAFEAAIMSHSDLDHYGGFDRLFGESKLRFKNVYTNGLMERASAKPDGALGPRRKKGSTSYIDALVPDKKSLERFLSKKTNVGNKRYPTMFRDALAAEKFDNFRMLSVDDGHLPGFGPKDRVTIEVLGPVVETVNKKRALRWFGDVGKTKNGHSVVLKLKYGRVSVLLGGDLNIPSENLLIEHHSGGGKMPKSEEGRLAFAKKLRKVFQVDFAKACHHGSADFSRAFLAAINPVATVISSGDDEAYSHPRADALGTIGRYSRGIRPLIFSTELARSSPERIKHPTVLRALVDKLLADAAAATTPAAKSKLQKEADKLKGQLDRSVATYGAINLRTDGHKVVVAQKIEKRRGKNKEWDAYQFEWSPKAKDWAFVSKFEDEVAADE
ncbi:MAG: MBL fold metallo-hydrolase [Reyranella sp.]|nr:MBL fold metallo-hydrolase [Reyranella sp.]